jgi:hypothetical protein
MFQGNRCFCKFDPEQLCRSKGNFVSGLSSHSGLGSYLFNKSLCKSILIIIY